ncbi:MAG: ribosome recycling factor [Armatimonadota bacterium]|nr:ribosome recycling factor [Armatimonadota bacterium]
MPDAVQRLLKETDGRMLEALEAVQHEFSLIRTGRANPAVLDRIRVEYYGQMVPIKQVATITAPEPRLLAITLWDKQMTKPVIDAITSSDLGLNPNSDGNIIRVPMPQLTTERRKELAKVVARKAEEGKVVMRNVRRDTVEKLRAMQKDGTISEDDLRRTQDQVQKVTNGHIEQLEGAQTSKEREILES